MTIGEILQSAQTRLQAGNMVTVAGVDYTLPVPSYGTPPIAPTKSGLQQFIEDAQRIAQQVSQGVSQVGDTIGTVGGILRDPGAFRDDLRNASQLSQLMPFLIGAALLLVLVLLFRK